jgi:hypothetical protein
MLKRQAQILARWLQQSSTGPGSGSEGGAAVREPRRRSPGDRGSSIGLPEPEPEMLVRAMRQPRRTR